MIMLPVILASLCLAGLTFGGLLLVWRAARRSAGGDLRNVTVSRAWLTHHQGEDRS
jgi:hypothetical protein